MMLHRHFEEDKAKREAGMTRLSDVAPSNSTDPNDPTYVPVPGDTSVDGEPPKKPGGPKKTN